jgi:hypothetical protein
MATAITAAAATARTTQTSRSAARDPSGIARTMRADPRPVKEYGKWQKM